MISQCSAAPMSGRPDIGCLQPADGFGNDVTTYVTGCRRTVEVGFRLPRPRSDMCGTPCRRRARALAVYIEVRCRVRGHPVPSTRCTCVVSTGHGGNTALWSDLKPNWCGTGCRPPCMALQLFGSASILLRWLRHFHRLYTRNCAPRLH